MKLPKLQPENVEQGGVTEMDQSQPSRVCTPETGKLISPELRAKALAALEEGLSATKRFWDRENEKWIVEPDYPTRSRNAELVIAYSDGKPVERKVQLTGDFKDWNSKMEDALASPEGIRVALAANLITEQVAEEKRQKLKGRREVAD